MLTEHLLPTLNESKLRYESLSRARSKYPRDLLRRVMYPVMCRVVISWTYVDASAGAGRYAVDPETVASQIMQERKAADAMGEIPQTDLKDEIAARIAQLKSDQNYGSVHSILRPLPLSAFLGFPLSAFPLFFFCARNALHPLIIFAGLFG